MPGTGVNLGPLHRSDPAFLGPYRLLGRLAAGGMGRVYLAARPDGGGLAAVKTLLAEGTVTEADRVRFAREVTVAQRVAAAHTARVLDADPHAARPWLATEYVAAPSLGELVARRGPADPAAVTRIARDCATALDALHAAGVVHRDLKPQNILLSSDGVRLIDFGISHATDLTRTKVTLGTIAYIAPEQARGEPATPAGDMYALGVTLCTLATGRPPYAEIGDPVRLLALVSRGKVDLDGVPDSLLPVVRACLELDPAHRPGPADLRALAEERAAVPWPPGPDTSHLPDGWAALVSDYWYQGRDLERQVRAEARPTTDPTPARRVAGLTPRGWKAAGTFVSSLGALILVGLGGLLVIITIVAVVIAVVAG
ncbi:serine/threonine-protein kinase [Streptomyces lancefieldiae]|uniref:Serine/threonine-protein kinase n=1 Tax=Streptomyces lancefieldiae TaxID=3075520 RepID=A0ABU3AY80_9ACTN|nr:serine/threonine-protein kinase [Streptomyces sp. DSM 40712]MDT0614883.1 serine/threonine-protein kinase [Streptomyces sp. DSM 40712]